MRRTSKKPKKHPGFVMALVVMLLPICFILLLVIGQAIIVEAGFAKHENGMGRAHYLAEAAVNAGFHALKTSNYLNATHSEPLENGDSAGAIGQGAANHLDPLMDGFTRDGEGWYVWTYDPNTDPPTKSLTGAGRPETMRYRVATFVENRDLPGGGQEQLTVWEVIGEATFDRFSRTHRLAGRRESLLDNAIFDNRDLSEFVRGADQTIQGKVHANGNLYIRPSGSDLTLHGLLDESGNPIAGQFKIESAGSIIRDRDAWNRPQPGGSVSISPTGDDTGFIDMEVGFDSENVSAWMDPTSGALARWNGFVRDSQLGGQVKEPPTFETFASGGFLHNSADLVIEAGTPDSVYLSTRTFYNEAEERSVTARVLNVRALRESAPGDWPENGLIYSDEPLIIEDAYDLTNPNVVPTEIGGVDDRLTVASDSTIYTRGDFNMPHPTAVHRMKATDPLFMREVFQAYPPGDPARSNDALWSQAVRDYLNTNGTVYSNAEWNALVTEFPQLGIAPDNAGSIYAPTGTDAGGSEIAYDEGYSNRKGAALMTSDRIYHVSEDGYDWPTSNNAPMRDADDPRRYNDNFGNLHGSGNVIARDDDDTTEIYSALIDGTLTVDERPWVESHNGVANPFYDTGSASGNGPNDPWANSDDFLERWTGSRTVVKRGSIMHMQNAVMAQFDNSNATAGNGITPWIRNTHYSPPKRDYGYDTFLRFNPPPFTPFIGTRERWEVLAR